jgi:antitoxin (DNA-binding transcriptional repressor) of toxin-antitoxin stability system
MQTLTITHAKKNLGKWLKAAARGEDIGIINGADVIALRKVPVESADYPQREYGATPAQLDQFAVATDALIERYRRSGTLGKYRVDPTQLLAQTPPHPSPRPRKSRHAA